MLLKKIILAAAVFAFLISGCSKSTAPVVKAGTEEKTITAKAEKSFSVFLEAQLSTGYKWKLMDAPASIILVQEGVVSESSAIDIAGGFEIQEFVLKSMEKGEFTVTFKYGEHWKKNNQYAKTYIVKVKIE